MTMRTTVVKTLRTLRLNKVAHKIYYRYVQGFDPMSQDVLDAIDRSLSKMKELRPNDNMDYLEFGIFKGYSFWYAQNKAGELGLGSMRFFGFDSFSGLPEPSDVDKTDDEVFYEGQYQCSKDDVIRNLDSKGVDWDKTYLVEGFFEDSLVDDLKKQHAIKSVGVALIDCDLYDSTRDVMSFLEDLIEENVILLFDDWNSFDGDESKGQPRAVREFLERAPAWRFEEFFSYGDYGQVFIVKKR